MMYQQAVAPPMLISLTALALPFVFAIAFLGLGLLLKRIAAMPAWLVNIGRASYSMYIFHFILAWFLCPILDAHLHDLLPAALRLVLYFALTVAATYLVAQQTLVWIEKPGIALGNRIIARNVQRTAPPASQRPSA
jgi:peptidoglycan/LPS O-acetylase OafA/YrhL